MDIATVVATAATCIATGIAVIGLVYSFLRNFKTDINGHIDRIEKRMDKFEGRMDKFEARMDMLDERMFWLATGKKLEDAILEERLNRKEAK